jgi:hypothetical protein
MHLSTKFFMSLKSVKKPLHKIAWDSGITPNQLYKITAGIDRPDLDDPRVKALCSYLGLSIEDAFESDATESHS